MGRGSSKSHKAAYGTEFNTLHTDGNIKFVKFANDKVVTAPQFTLTPGRIYATIGKKNEVKHITYYDSEGNRFKQIDVHGHTHEVDGVKVVEHTHLGFNHEEGGTRGITPEEKTVIDKVRESWNNFNMTKPKTGGASGS